MMNCEQLLDLYVLNRDAFISTIEKLDTIENSVNSFDNPLIKQLVIDDDTPLIELVVSKLSAQEITNIRESHVLISYNRYSVEMFCCLYEEFDCTFDDIIINMFIYQRLELVKYIIEELHYPIKEHISDIFEILHWAYKNYIEDEDIDEKDIFDDEIYACISYVFSKLT